MLVAHSFPPRPSSASRRPAALAKYLSRLGYRVVVLTSAAWGSGGVDPALEVVRARDLFSSPLNWRRRNVEAYEGRSQRPYSTRHTWASRLATPDVVAVTWVPFALPAALRVARDQRIDCVITTSPPESAQLIGLALHRRGIPWVADLRDGWRFESVLRPSFAPSDRLDRWLEARALRRADRVVAVSEPISEDLRRRLGIHATTIPNGFDPEEPLAPASSVGGLLDPRRRSLLHTGSLASSGRSLKPLLKAVELLAKRAPDDLRRMEIVLAGPISEGEQRMLRESSLGPTVRHVGNVERARALRLQAEADRLLVVTAGTRRGELPGKLFEYLRAGRPVLVLGERSEAARVVKQIGAGGAAPADDPEAVAGELSAFAAGRADGFDEETLKRARAEYSHERIAERMAAVVDEARRR
jgi:glycosyltransferase involved in cell wall biosynthesis